MTLAPTHTRPARMAAFCDENLGAKENRKGRRGKTIISCGEMFLALKTQNPQPDLAYLRKGSAS